MRDTINSVLKNGTDTKDGPLFAWFSRSLPGASPIFQRVIKRSLILLVSGAVLGAVGPVGAADTTWTAAVNDDFYNPGNWDTGVAPASGDRVLILDPAVTAVIDFAGSREIDSLHLGTEGATGGNVDFRGGELVVQAFFDRSLFGDRGSLDSTMVMRGDAVLLFDGPLDGGGFGFGSSGGNQDLEVGAQTGATGNLGLLELHDTAILRVSDDLKIGAEANGNGEVRIDGNATISVGSGISLSESNPSQGTMTVAGSALVVSGNSAGAGNSAQGVSDEGYFTLSTTADSTAELLIKDSGKVYARTLQQRGGVSNMTIQDNGEFHVFDAFHFATPQLGVATVVGDPFGPVRASHVAQNNESEFNLLIAGNGKMSIDSAVDDGTGQTIQGLALSGGNNRGAFTGTGGRSNIELRDNASFVIQQNLYMTAASVGTPVGASSTLRIMGPNVEARIEGDLYMSFDPVLQLQNADPSTLSAVITGSTHSTIEVGGQANIEFGNLAVELSGYSPRGGETYTLLTADSILGANFLNTDFSLAPLADGLSWDLDVGASSVVLTVLGSVGLPGDYNNDGKVDGDDYVIWKQSFNSTTDLAADGNGNNVVDAADYTVWRDNLGTGGAALALSTTVPEPSMTFLAAVGLSVLMARTKRDSRHRIVSCVLILQR